jgi:hypothetical protein
LIPCPHRCTVSGNWNLLTMLYRYSAPLQHKLHNTFLSSLPLLPHTPCQEPLTIASESVQRLHYGLQHEPKTITYQTINLKLIFRRNFVTTNPPKKICGNNESANSANTNKGIEVWKDNVISQKEHDNFPKEKKIMNCLKKNLQ